MSGHASRPGRWRTTLLAGAGFLVLQIGWILCIAPNYGIDEFDHSYRASSVAAGHWKPGDQPVATDLGRGDLIPVRPDVLEAAQAACKARPYTGLYNCQAKSTLPSGEVEVASAASRYNPAFYAVVGLAAAPFEGTAHLYAMRATAALLGLALFMMTVWLTLAGARTVWPLVVVLAAALPTTIYSASLVSPNGLELLAGLGTWVALLAVVAPRGEQRRRTAYGMLGVFAAVLANTHTLGLLWLALILLAVAMLHGPVAMFRALLPRTPREGIVAALAACAAAFEIAWVALSGVNNPTLDQTEFTSSPWPWVFQGFVLWPFQAIGAFPMRNESAPLVVYALILIVLAALAVAAIRSAGLRSRPVLGLGFIAAASFLVPAYLTVQTFEQLGSAWQGRYGMPFTVGLLVVAGTLIDASARQTTLRRALAPAAVMMLLIAQTVSQWSVMTKQRSDFDLVAGTDWVPPSAALMLTLGALAVVCWTRTVAGGDPTSKEANDDRDPASVLR